MQPGTIIFLRGLGVGTYVRINYKVVGWNSHVVDFGRGEKTVDLKGKGKADFFVKYTAAEARQRQADSRAKAAREKQQREAKKQEEIQREKQRAALEAERIERQRQQRAEEQRKRDEALRGIQESEEKMKQLFSESAWSECIKHALDFKHRLTDEKATCVLVADAYDRPKVQCQVYCVLCYGMSEDWNRAKSDAEGISPGDSRTFSSELKVHLNDPRITSQQKADFLTVLASFFNRLNLVQGFDRSVMEAAMAACEVNPQHMQAWLYQAQQHFLQGSWEDCIQCSEKGLSATEGTKYWGKPAALKYQLDTLLERAKDSRPPVMRTTLAAGGINISGFDVECIQLPNCADFSAVPFEGYLQGQLLPARPSVSKGVIQTTIIDKMHRCFVFVDMKPLEHLKDKKCKMATPIYEIATNCKRSGAKSVIVALPERQMFAWSWKGARGNEPWSLVDWGRCLSREINSTSCNRSQVPIFLLLPQSATRLRAQLRKKITISLSDSNPTRIFKGGEQIGLPNLSDELGMLSEAMSEAETQVKLDVLARRDRWHFDPDAVFEKLRKSLRSSNFHVCIVLALRIAELQLQHDSMDVAFSSPVIPWMAAEFIRATLRSHIFSWKWCQASLRKLTATEAQQLNNMLLDCIDGRSLGTGPTFSVHDTVSIQRYYASCNPTEHVATWARILKTFVQQNGSQSDHLLPIITDAISSLRIAKQSFSMSDHESLLRHIPVANLRQLSTLLNLGNFEPPPKYVDEIVLRQLKRQVQVAQTPTTLSDLWSEFSTFQNPSLFASAATPHILSTFSPYKINIWLTTPAYKALSKTGHDIPSAQDLFDKARTVTRDSKESLRSYINLLAKAEELATDRAHDSVQAAVAASIAKTTNEKAPTATVAEAESEESVTGTASAQQAIAEKASADVEAAKQALASVPKVVAETLNMFFSNCLDGNGMEVWCEIVDILDVSLVQHHRDVVLEVLEAGGSFGNSPKERAKSADHFCRCLSGKPLSSTLSSVIQLAVDRLITSTKLDNNRDTMLLPNISKGMTPHFGSDAPFWARCCIRIAQRSKIMAHLKDRDSFVKWLQGWNFGPAKLTTSLLSEWIRVSSSLQFKGDEDSLILATRYLQPLRESFCNIFATIEAVKLFSHQQLKVLKQQKPVVELFLDLYKSAKDTKMAPGLSSIDECLTIWDTEFKYIKSEEAVLNALNKSHIPEIVTTLEEETKFRMKLEDPALQSVSTQEICRRADLIRQNMQQFVDEFEHFRAFVDHFIVHISQQADNKSVLFPYLVTEELKRQPGEKWATARSYSRSLYSIHRYLMKLLHLADRDGLSFDELMTFGMILQRNLRPIPRELDLLFEFFDQTESSTRGSISSSVQADLEQILQLCGYREPLQILCLGQDGKPGTLRRYGFKCAQNNDPNFKELTDLACNLCDSNVTRTWNAVQCKERLDQLRRLFCPNEDRSQDEVLGLLCLFENLALGDKVWEFVHKHQKEYVDSSGRGYSGMFNQKVENFLAQLGGEDIKLLTNFKPVVQWVSVLVFQQARANSFDELMTALWSVNKISEQARQPKSSKPFSQLQTAEDNMDYLGELFRKGLGGLDAVLGQFEDIDKCCKYIFDLQAAELSIKFKDQRKKHEVQLDAAAVLDFEQRLGFVQYEDKAREYSIAPYLVKLQHYRRSLGLMCELHTLGHRDWSATIKIFVAGTKSQSWKQMGLGQDNSILAPAWLLPGQLETGLHRWKANLQDVCTANKFLSLFSIVAAQRIDVLMTKRSGRDLALLLCPLCLREKADFDSLLQRCNQQLQVPLDADAGDWHNRTATFVQGVVALLQRTAVSRSVSRYGTALVNRGPARYTARADHGALLQLLQFIFGERAPEPFELLWCAKETTEQMLLAFIERSKHFPECRFVLLQVELMAPALQHVLLRQLLTMRDMTKQGSDGHNLSWVETGPCVLQSASWISPKAADQVCKDIDLDTHLSSWVFGSDCVLGTCKSEGGITCFHGPYGSGKTYQIRKRLAALGEQHVHTCTVSITEAFSFGGVARQLSQALRIALDGSSRGDVIMAVYFSINLGKFKGVELRQWSDLMQLISKFFFSLLVLRSVEDPSTGDCFNVPPGANLQVFVEIPDRQGHLEVQGARRSSSSLIEEIVAEVPILAAIGDFRDAAQAEFDINDEALHVAKYLKADQDGTIDQLYGGAGASGPKDVLFVLDDSGSMAGSRIETCRRCLTDDIIASRLHAQDKAGYMVLCQRGLNVSLAQCSPQHMGQLQAHIAATSANGGSTPLWSVMQQAVEVMANQSSAAHKWIVALTDGHAHDMNLMPTVSARLRSATGQHIRILFITVGLEATYADQIRQHIIRAEGDAVIPADGGVQALQQAWTEVGERLTVSEQIEKAGESITSAECRTLLRRYMELNGKNCSWSRLKQTHWIRYLYRRCGILASSEKFNKNKDLPKFGSTTMKIMLGEVAHALADNYEVDWHSINHKQLVYCKEIVEEDGKRIEDYKWSVLATNPEDPEFQSTLQLLKSLRMHVPTSADLRREDRRILDSYLANGLGIELHDKDEEDRSTTGDLFDFEIGTLPTIDQKQFVLTLDFLMKMLCMNERIECRVPCIMEGETGVSKTALTRMLFILKNTEFRATSPLEQCIREKAAEMQANSSFSPDEVEVAILQKLADYWHTSEQIQTDATCWKTASRLAASICENTSGADVVAKALVSDLRADPGLDPLLEIEERVMRESCEPLERTRNPHDVGQLLRWYVKTLISRDECSTDWTFHPVDVHAALTPEQIADDPTTGVNTVVARSQRLVQLAELLDSDRHRKATLCIFFDEVNTSSCMGVFKELVIDHSLNGVQLPNNIVIVAACNPAREKIELAGDRREELGSEWAIGHYQVHPLALSLQQMTWKYGSLRPEQEWEFIQKRLRFIQSMEGLTEDEVETLAALIYTSQTTSREFAVDHIRSIFEAKRGNVAMIDEAELTARASSSVSLRDILRVFKLFSYFTCTSTDDTFLPGCSTRKEARHSSMLLAIAVVYYLRLGVGSNVDHNFRRKFCQRLRDFNAPAFESTRVMSNIKVDLDAVLIRCMEAIMDETHLEPGIAKTRGLQENIFMVVVCCLAQVPLMIVGPPGSSKTLAVTVVEENARGEYSRTDLYKKVAALIPFRYQCSRRSTSNEIKAVFERAIDRQAKIDSENGGRDAPTRCFVFMDEAGLPEEERESLKVLHYYLEDHMSVAAHVGFVAITNHLLDAAKSNRCALLTRTKPDHDELMNVARGCLGSDKERRSLVSSVCLRTNPDLVLKLDPSRLDSSEYGLLDHLCETYDACMSEYPRREELVKPPSDFVCFFGLRDFMHLVKLLGRLAKGDHGKVSAEKLLCSLQRNMNGIEPAKLVELLAYYMQPYRTEYEDGFGAVCDLLSLPLYNPLDLLLESLKEKKSSSTPIGRYILVIETTRDDSVLRSLQSTLKQHAKVTMLKLSHFQEDSAIQEVNVISQVKWAAEKGDVVILSQTEKINESFYDLFNQHFRKFEEKNEDGIEVTYHTNIAVGAHSRRCKVSPGFECIVHLSQAELQLAPAPFLNRFEKYRLSQKDLLESHVQHRDLPAAETMKKVLRKQDPNVVAHVKALVTQIGVRSFYGFCADQTIESGLLYLLSKWKAIEDVVDDIIKCMGKDSFCSVVREELAGDDRAIDCFAVLQTDSTQLTVVLGTTTNEIEAKVADVLLAQCIIHNLVQQLLQIVIPEQLFQHPHCLPQDLLQYYLAERQHFNLQILLHSLTSVGGARKHIVYSRTSAKVLALQTGAASEEDLGSLAGDIACSALSFSQLTRESQLNEQFKEFFHPDDKRNVLLVFVDVAHTSTSQINFIRYKIDQMATTDHMQQHEKTFVLLMHVPPSDLCVHSGYDTTFCDEWQSTFLDSVDREEATEWLFLGADLSPVTKQRFTTDDPWSMILVLDGWLSLAVDVVARCVELPKHLLHGPNLPNAGGVLDRRRAVIDSLLNIKLAGQTMSNILLTRFADLWAGDDGCYTRLRNYLKQRIRALAAGDLQVALVEALTGDIRDMFVKFLAHIVGTIFEDMNPALILNMESTHKEEVGTILQIMIRSMSRLNVLPFPELASPLRPYKVKTAIEAPLHSKVPFFGKLARLLDRAAAQANAKFAEYDEEDEGEVWDLIIQDMERQIRTLKNDPMAEVVVFAFENPTDDLWIRYLDTFIYRRHPIKPGQNKNPLQHDILRAWLTSHISMERNPHAKVAALHAVVLWDEALEQVLESLILCVEPLACLNPARPMAERVTSIVDSAEHDTDSLRDEMFDAFYELLLQQMEPHSTFASLQKWVDAFTQAKVQDVSTAHDVDCKKHDVMCVVQVATRCVDSGCITSLRRLIGDLDALVGGTGATRLSLVDIWGALEAETPNMLASNVHLCTSLVQLWSNRKLTRVDLSCLVDTVLCNKYHSISQSIPMLQTVLLGHQWDQLQKSLKTMQEESLGSWLKFGCGTHAGVGVVLEKCFKCEELLWINGKARPYMPEWFVKELPKDELHIDTVISTEMELADVDGVLELNLDVGNSHQASANEKEMVDPLQQASGEVFESPIIQLGHSFFYVVWKWIVMRYRRDDLSELARVVQDLEPVVRGMDSNVIQRGIAIAAVRVLMLDRLAGRIADESRPTVLEDRHEVDRVCGQLEALSHTAESEEGWASELAYAVCMHLNGNAESGLTRLTACAECERSNSNRELSRWLELAKTVMGSDANAWLVLFANRRPKLVMPQLLDSQLISNRGSMLDVLQDCTVPVVGAPAVVFLRELLDKREKLRLLWVVPDVIEFYDWITMQLINNNIAEGIAKDLKVRKFLELEKTPPGAKDDIRINEFCTIFGCEDDESYYKRLWVRVKVGINTFVTHCGVNDVPPIDEDVCVWNLVSTDKQRSTSDDLLYTALQNMLSIYSDFIRVSGAKMQCQPRQLNATTRALDALAEIDPRKMQQSLDPDEMELVTHTAQFEHELQLRYDFLDFVGPLAQCTERARFSCRAMTGPAWQWKGDTEWKQYGPDIARRLEQAYLVKDTCSEESQCVDVGCGRHVCIGTMTQLVTKEEQRRRPVRRVDTFEPVFDMTLLNEHLDSIQALLPVFLEPLYYRKVCFADTVTSDEDQPLCNMLYESLYHSLDYESLR
eukprot:COSAG01_NODE_556_length_15526_cov_13.393725_1_plen_5121_part_01